MKMQNLLAILAAMMLAASTGCLGGLDSNPPGTPDPTPDPDPNPNPNPDPQPTAAQQLFDTNVKPLLSSCGDAACHGGTGTYPLKFLGTDATTWYDTITAEQSLTGGFEPTLASLINKLAEPHQTQPAWTDTQSAAITEWLLQERVDRNLDPIDPGTGDPPPPTDSVAALAEWSGCMLKTNWDQAQMGEWANKRTNNGEQCSQCHDQGAYRFNTNNTNDTMFQMNQYQLFIISFFTVETELDGTVKVIPATDKIMRMGNGSTLHQRFNVDPNDQYFQYLQNFYDLTMATKAAGQCGPAQFPQL